MTVEKPKPKQFKADRLQIIVVAKKYLCCNCSSVGCLKCVQFYNWFRLHLILYQLQNISGGATHNNNIQNINDCAQ